MERTFPSREAHQEDTQGVKPDPGNQHPCKTGGQHQPQESDVPWRWEIDPKQPEKISNRIGK